MRASLAASARRSRLLAGWPISDRWREQVIQEGPDKSRTNGSVALIDYSGSTIATWSFEQGWPIKYTGATLNAGGNEVAVEEIQICHEGLKRL